MRILERIAAGLAGRSGRIAETFVVPAAAAEALVQGPAADADQNGGSRRGSRPRNQITAQDPSGGHPQRHRQRGTAGDDQDGQSRYADAAKPVGDAGSESVQADG